MKDWNKLWLDVTMIETYLSLRSHSIWQHSFLDVCLSFLPPCHPRKLPHSLHSTHTILGTTGSISTQTDRRERSPQSVQFVMSGVVINALTMNASIMADLKYLRHVISITLCLTHSGFLPFFMKTSWVFKVTLWPLIMIWEHCWIKHAGVMWFIFIEWHASNGRFQRHVHVYPEPMFS